MDFATGAMGSLLNKLGEMLKEEYNLQRGVKGQVRSVRRELESTQTALVKIGKVPRGELDEQIKLWSDEIREVTYQMEDILDTVLVSAEFRESSKGSRSNWLKEVLGQMGDMLKKAKCQHRLAVAVKEIQGQLEEVSLRRDRNIVDVKIVKPVLFDPRVKAFYNESPSLVGIKGKRDVELMKLLLDGDSETLSSKLKIVSVVGSGGLGKTTLVHVVYEMIKDHFSCKAFVTVGQHPDAKKVLFDVWKGVTSGSSDGMDCDILECDIFELIGKLKSFLHNRRYLVVIDDIWNKDLWETVSVIFAHSNSHGSRLVSTTRNLNVAEACCSSPHDVIYSMKALTAAESEVLFCRRVFSDGGVCPNDLKSVTAEILHKCGGVPLAIITITSMLASEVIQPVHKWTAILDSIGHGLTDKDSSGALRNILLLSYDDLSHQLRNILLYLSIHPEDCTIYRDEVIWKMIAEGIIQSVDQRCTYELGVTYINELVNRNLLIPSISLKSGELVACRIHDMLLDILRSLSKEQNFTCVLDDTTVLADKPVRRLSIQCSHVQAAEVINSMEVAQIRSVTLFPHAESVIDMTVLLPKFKILRVLDLRDCNLNTRTYKINLSVVCNLLHLRFLGLANTGVREVPEEIGNLQFLQYLDVMGCDYLTLFPMTIRYLKRLLVLFGSGRTKVPGGFGDLTNLEVLKAVRFSLGSVRELVKLSKLRELVINFMNESLELEHAFVNSVRELQNIQVLVIEGDFELMDYFGEQWVAPQVLRFFDSFKSGIFSKLPAWLKKDHSWFSNLSHLSLKVLQLDQSDMRVLGNLPSLLALMLESTEQTDRSLSIGADGFKCLVSLEFGCRSGAQVFLGEGCLPRVTFLRIDIGLQAVKDNGKADCPLSLKGNLVSLQAGIVCIYPMGVTNEETEEMCDAVQRASEAHPNSPDINILIQTRVKIGMTG